MTIYVSKHAIDRYRERVAPVSRAEIRRILSGPAIERAIAFAARFVRLGTGHRVCLVDNRVVTVLPKDAPNNLRARDHDARHAR